MRDDDPSTDAVDLLTVTEAAQRARLSRHTISGWIARGLLPAVRIGGRRYIRPENLAATQVLVHAGEVVPAWRQDPRRAGKRLRALREAAGLSQLQLEAASGLTHEVLSLLETGNRPPRAETIRALAQALQVAPERFVGQDPIGLTMLTVTEVATQLGISARRVQDWLKEGTLAGTKVSGQWRVAAVVVAELDRSGRLRGHSRRLDPRYRS